MLLEQQEQILSLTKTMEGIFFMRESKQKLLIINILKQVAVFAVIFISFYSFSKEKVDKEQNKKINKEFEFLGSNSEALEIMSSQFGYQSSLNIVQKRLLPRKFLSEISMVVSPVIKGITYLNSGSLDATYRFYLDSYWSAHLKYSYFFNRINKEGEDMFRYSQSPVDLQYSQKKEYSLGFDWTPFYGKVAVLNKVIHFDIYLSLSGGFLELFRLDGNRIPTASLAGGFVLWLSKRVNARLGLSGSYYQYKFNESMPNAINKYLSKGHVSVGILF